ncbi:MAG: hypothetical protein BJ554DRAFT_1118, partial [Olpidium bornovanus]
LRDYVLILAVIEENLKEYVTLKGQLREVLPSSVFGNPANAPCFLRDGHQILTEIKAINLQARIGEEEAEQAEETTEETLEREIGAALSQTPNTAAPVSAAARDSKVTLGEKCCSFVFALCSDSFPSFPTPPPPPRPPTPPPPPPLHLASRRTGSFALVFRQVGFGVGGGGEEGGRKREISPAHMQSTRPRVRGRRQYVVCIPLFEPRHSPGPGVFRTTALAAGFAGGQLL